MQRLIIDENYDGLIDKGSRFRFNGAIEFDGAIEFRLNKPLDISLYIEAGGWIEAGNSIKAGDWIKAGNWIEAGGWIEADNWIKAGNSIKAGDWISQYGIKTKELIVMFGLKYQIWIWGGFIKIGCQKHSKEDWGKFSDEKISKMDSNALEWWNKHKTIILNAHNEPFKGEQQ